MSAERPEEEATAAVEMDQTGDVPVVALEEGEGDAPTLFCSFICLVFFGAWVWAIVFSWDKMQEDGSCGRLVYSIVVPTTIITIYLCAGLNKHRFKTAGDMTYASTDTENPSIDPSGEGELPTEAEPSRCIGDAVCMVVGFLVVAFFVTAYIVGVVRESKKVHEEGISNDGPLFFVTFAPIVFACLVVCVYIYSPVRRREDEADAGEEDAAEAGEEDESEEAAERIKLDEAADAEIETVEAGELC